MGYYDPPDEDYPPGCDYCGAGEDDLGELPDGTVWCTKCHTRTDWSFEYCKTHPCYINNYFEPEPEPPIEEPLTPEEERKIEQLREESERRRMIELGYLDEATGELTDAFYRAADFAYDCARERR